MLWLWNGPLPEVPPHGSRTVIGQGTRVRQNSVAAWLTIWLKPSVEKSANCISMIGRMPSMAAPTARPIIASSLIGASITRPGNFAPGSSWP